MAIFKGAGVAIVTPMYDNEEVNYDKLEELINMQIDNGTDAIIIAGTTGESPCLSMEEHAKVIKAALSDKSLFKVDKIKRDEVRADILKNILMNL